MGYESKLIIGQRVKSCASLIKDGITGVFDHNCCWFQEYAAINLSKIGGLDIQYDKFPKVYIFSSDGTTEIKEDRYYGDPLVALPPDLVLEQLKEKDQEYGDHRRIKWAISLIEHMIELQGERENIEIVHFGY